MTEESAGVRAPELSGGHELTLSTDTTGLALCAYTFVSCVMAAKPA